MNNNQAKRIYRIVVFFLLVLSFSPAHSAIISGIINDWGPTPGNSFSSLLGIGDGTNSVILEYWAVSGSTTAINFGARHEIGGTTDDTGNQIRWGAVSPPSISDLVISGPLGNYEVIPTVSLGQYVIYGRDSKFGVVRVDNIDVIDGQSYLDATWWFNNTGTDFSEAIDPKLSGIPIPGAIWLFGTGLLWIAGLTRRKKI